VARARLPRLLGSRTVAADVAGGRRDANLFWHTALPERGVNDRRLGAARTNHRRRGDAAAGGRWTRARGGILRRRTVPLDRGDSCGRHLTHWARVLLAADASATFETAASLAAPSRRAGAAHRLRGHARLSEPLGGDSRGDAGHARRPSSSDYRNLAPRRIRRHPSFSTPVFHDGTAPVPRDARPVHDQWVRRPRSDVRELPRAARRRRRSSVCNRVLVLRPRHRHLDPGRGNRRPRARSQAAKEIAAPTRIRPR
jgi:hypothetical protein